MLASTLLGLDPPVLPVGRLVATAGLFGIAESTARTALSRMAAAGEVVAEGGRYRLTGRLLDRQRRQDEGRHARMRTWRGRWRMAIVTTERRTPTERAELRAALLRLRLVEWREGVWLRPDNLGEDPRRRLMTLARGARIQDHCSWLVADLDAAPLHLWDLDGWANEARDLLEELRALPPDSLADGFVLSAAVLRHLAADPLLPTALLPMGWPGEELRSTYDAWDRAYREVLATWHRAQRG